MKLQKTAAVLFVLLLIGYTNTGAQEKVLYPYLMNPTEHPDYLRHATKVPDYSVFGNITQFMALRDLSGPDYKKRITRWVDKDKLGNILWVHYTLLFQDNLKEVVAEIKKRDLYLFDLWGYNPGSGPDPNPDNHTAYQYVIPDGALDLFRNELGDRWLGMDNGEQDGRYINRFAPAMTPMGGDRRQQYFNFQRHFQEMGEQLGNRLATLVTLNFGHYFLKEGIYTMIGAETAQGLPNSQIYYSFIRGAGKQYGVPWFGNVSVWNRWGWKTYDPKIIRYDEKDYGAGNPLKGTSLSLLKRLLYTHLFYDCVAAGFEGSMRMENEILSPIGRIQQEAVKWSGKYGDPGTMYTPVAFMLDFFSGWSFPRHLYSRQAYRVWGNLPYEASDYLTDNMLALVYPGYQDASYYHDERGFIAPTPFGDIADCLMSDAPLWLLKQYPLLVIADKLQPGVEIKDKLEQYAKAGGHLVITSGSIEGMPDGLAGVTVKSVRTMSAAVIYHGREIRENDSFLLAALDLPDRAETVQTCNGLPAIAEIPYGKGKVTVIASPFAVPEHPQCALPVKVREEQPLDKPYPMLKHVQAYMKDLFAGLALFETDPALSTVTCVKNENEYSVLVTNSGWEARPFSIKSRIGKIASIREMKINEDEMKAVGYTPKVVTVPSGKNTASQIAGGGTRAYSIKISRPEVKVADKVPTVPNAKGRALTLRNIRNLKEEILSRPTFFEHYDRAVIDWRYIEEKEPKALSAEAGWFERQKLKISVDLASGINLYPDLRIINNDELRYQQSIQRMKDVIDKMQLIGADELIVSSQPPVQNNFTGHFNKLLTESFQLLADYAKGKGIRLLYRLSIGKVGANAAEAVKIVKEVNRPNFRLAPSVALLLINRQNLDRNLEILKQTEVESLIMAAPQRDMHGQIWDMNCPIHLYGDQEAIARIVRAFPKAAYIMDGLYRSWDDEYLDVSTLKKCLGQE